MEDIKSFENFYAALQKINVLNQNLTQKRDTLREICMDFNHQFQSMDRKVVSGVDNKEITESLAVILDSLSLASDSWLKTIEEMLKKQQFRSDLKNYFIVMVFGKVKAGKSSLGNFIAQHKPQNMQASFFEYDEVGKEKQWQGADEFATDNLECTNSIQGFKLNGLAWVDTPGLGSMTPENGKLAKEYINAADYIVYPTDSSSPMQNDEIEQIEELFQYGKKISVCITKSDTTDYKRDENNKIVKQNGHCKKVLVNKSQDVRREQEDYVNDLVTKSNTAKQSMLGDIFSISVHCAQAGLKEDNSELFNRSNIAKFYDLLTDVVENKATQLNKETPYKELIAFIDNDVIGQNFDKKATLEDIRGKLRQLQHNLETVNCELNTLIENVKSDISTIVFDVVAKYEQSVERHNAKQMFQTMEKEIIAQVETLMTDNFSQLFEGVSPSLDELVTSMATDDFNIKDINKTLHFSTKEKNKKIGSAIGATIFAVGAAAMTGGASLAVTMAAGYAGSTLGGAAGEMIYTDHTETISVGDNKHEVIARFRELQITHHHANSKKLYIEIQKDFFKPLTQSISAMLQNVDNFENRLEQLKKELS